MGRPGLSWVGSAARSFVVRWFAGRRLGRSRFALLVAVIAALAFPLGDIAAAAAGTFVSYTYNGLGGTRPYSVYTPANYTTSQQVPLIVMLHGCGGSPNDFANTTQMNVLADTNQFIVV